MCNMASIAVNMFVDTDNRIFDFEKLKTITKVVTYNLDKIIDVNYYPIPKTEEPNKKHRPIGIGIQGLADVFLLMQYKFESNEAKKLNQQNFETLYYGALEASCEISMEKGQPYGSYRNSEVSKGLLQYDMWIVTPTDLWDWDKLKKKIDRYGISNSLLIAQTPDETLANILGNTYLLNHTIAICTLNVNRLESFK
ncbi:ribonucleoside-diphosphate reductase large subunit-like [Prorops nasuta]|uniref:ribonucleoside-diphosphate reductase large subunit-like n=1 Tax=Prorops nasuta TaxID=863751 RepID=UPI0034CF698F